jgi:hypothetical protein
MNTEAIMVDVELNIPPLEFLSMNRALKYGQNKFVVITV